MPSAWPPVEAIDLPAVKILGPKTIAPASAAEAPAACTKVDPAKSEKPSSFSHPPPHCHEASIGYKNAVNKI